jgi:hypothetical protein
MNPRDYRTWTSFADHPVFSDRRDSIADWSSDPEAYHISRYFPRRFDPEWYVHVDPKLPTELQAAHAARDIRNLADFCDALDRKFGSFGHELFILDDYTVYVRVNHSEFTLDLSPHDYGDRNEILTMYVKFPFDDELVVDMINDGIARLAARLGNA